MKGQPGLIVSVKPKNEQKVKYLYNNNETYLSDNEEFIGYFWQTTGKANAHITKIELIDKEKLLFRYSREAIFDINTVDITVKAKRGPIRDTIGMPPKYDKYEIWNNY